MDQKRFLIFILSTFAILVGWEVLVLRRFAPPPEPAAPIAAQAPDADAKDRKKPGAAKDAEAPAAQAAETPAVAAAPEEADADRKDELPELVKHPHRSDLTIGTLDPDSPYRMQVTFTTRGASIAEIALNDPRYRDLENPDQPLKVVGADGGPPYTLQTAVPEIDEQLRKYNTSLRTVDWEVVQGSHSPSAITFRYVTPDDKIEVVKKYRLTPLDPAKPGESAAYDLHFDLTFRNRGEQPQTLSYVLQGPVGVPLESEQYARKFRDVAVGFLEPDGRVRKNVTLDANSIADGEIEDWRRPMKYIGIDVQYFAALLLPQGDQLQEPYIASAKAMLVGPDRDRKSNISVQLTSVDLTLPAAKAGQQTEEVTHSYMLFAGPKRVELLEPIHASTIIDYGFSGNLGIPQAMLALLDFFHRLFPQWAWPYGWAIILLTVVVRSAMFPLSRKQALAAAKMQEIQPEIAALKKKYGNDTEKLGRAQMELFRKHNYNPFGGCLLMLVQLPIFIGLYQALNISVDLRSAKFLWIDNLAAPDRLFTLPFSLPFLGSDFNLLPIITICLFILQQKMFMPPPTDKEQELQQKMMSYMMIFMGFMFYSVPAGLCIYFIASSGWGLAERKLLPKAAPRTADASGGTNGGPGGGGPGPDRPSPVAPLPGGKKKSRQRR